MNTELLLNSNQPQAIHLQAILAETCAGLRLDKAIAMTFSQFSREKMQQWIHQGVVYLDGAPIMSIKHKVK